MRIVIASSWECATEEERRYVCTHCRVPRETRVRLEVLPVLQKQPGFVDLMALRDDEDPQKIVCLSFWETQDNAENYRRDHYDSVVHILRSMLERDPTVETFKVEVSTSHHIAASFAA
jgi:heme-degrading monooxygenase HmoA